MNWKDYITGMLGENSPQDFFHAYNWAIVAAVLSLCYDVMRRNPSSRHSPSHFSWTFFLRDNLLRVFTSLVTIAAVLRFSNELLGAKPSAFTGFGIGLSLDRIIQYVIWLKTKGQNEKLKIPNRNMTVSVCFPTIDPSNDILESFNTETFASPMTGTMLVGSDTRFYLAKDDQNNDVISMDIDDSDPMPTLTGVSFAVQVAEYFVGPRPARRRPRPI